MDKELQLIEHLYDEVSSDSQPLRELLQDPDLSTEYQALSGAKFALDHRAKVRPRSSVVNAIVREAALGADRTAARADRPPLRLLPIKRRSLVGGLALAAALALTVMVRPWSFVMGTDPVQAVADNPFDFEVPAESLLRALPPGATPIAQSPPQMSDWDSGDDLRRLSRRIQALQAAGVDSWGSPAVPLEMLPTGSAAGLQTAGSRR